MIDRGRRGIRSVAEITTAPIANRPRRAPRQPPRGATSGGLAGARDSFPFERAPRGIDELAAGRVPLVRRLRQRGREDGVERLRELGPHLGEARRRLVQVGEDDRQLALALERPRAGEALEEDAAERVDVGAAVDRAALDLLGRDVVDRPDEAAVAGQAADRRDVPGEAEVADVRVLAVRVRRDEDVAGLHVAVDEPGRVRGVERAGDLRDEVERAPGSSRPSRRSSSRRSEPST